jgi:hypothetical protein
MSLLMGYTKRIKPRQVEVRFKRDVFLSSALLDLVTSIFIEYKHCVVTAVSQQRNGILILALLDY